MKKNKLMTDKDLFLETIGSIYVILEDALRVSDRLRHSTEYTGGDEVNKDIDRVARLIKRCLVLCRHDSKDDSVYL